MQFIYPSFLAALGFLAIPIIIHLFNFRRFKTIYFSNVRFLREVNEATQSYSKLKHLLILCCRILALALLILAFAQPFIPQNKNSVKQGAKAVSIYVDNSFSMEAVGTSGTLLEEAKKNALNILKAYGTADKFQLLTNDFEGKNQRWVNKEIFSQLLEEVKISPVSRHLDEIITRQKDLLNLESGLTKESFLLSDFQTKAFAFENIKNDTAITFNLIPFKGNETANLYIDSCWFETPSRQLNANEQLYVKLKNGGDKDAEQVPIKLVINGLQRALANADVKAKNEAVIVLNYTNKETGFYQGELVINDYPIVYDNNFFLSYTVAPKINVLVINHESENAFINKLFATDNAIKLTQVNEKNIDYAALKNYDLLIACNLNELSSGFAEELNKNITNGLSALMFPGNELNLSSYNNLLNKSSITIANLDTSKTKVEKINMQHPLYRDVFDVSKIKNQTLNLPVVFKHYVISNAAAAGRENLLDLQNGDAFLSQYTLGKGKLYLCASPLNELFSTFAKHALFVPTLYKIALNSNVSNNLYYTIGKSEAVIVKNTSDNNDPIFRLQSSDNKISFITSTKTIGFATSVNADKQIKIAQSYFLKNNENDTLNCLSFNYSRLESDADFMSAKTIEDKVNKLQLTNFNIMDKGENNLASIIGEGSRGKQLWKWCIVMALVFLALEIGIIRWMKG